MHTKLDSWWPTVLRYAGLAIAVYEVVWDKVDRPSILILAAGMMGLNSILKLARADTE